MTQQRLRSHKLLLRLLADRQLEREPGRCDRRQSTGSTRRSRWFWNHLGVRWFWNQYLLFPLALEPYREVRPRRQPREQDVDLRLALPARLGDQRLGVLLAEVRRKTHDCGQVQPPRLHLGKVREHRRGQPPLVPQ